VPPPCLHLTAPQSAWNVCILATNDPYTALKSTSFFFFKVSIQITLLCNAIEELRTTVTTMNTTLVKLVPAPIVSSTDSPEVPSLDALNITASPDESPVNISPVQLNVIPISTIPVVSPITAPAAFPAMTSITTELTVSPSTLPSPAPIGMPNPPAEALSGVQFGEAVRDVFLSQHWYLIAKGLQTGVFQSW
jgi:hypothetical protein